MLVISCRASTRYEGRVDAELLPCDVTLQLRLVELGGDGSVLVSRPTRGLPPVNWMPGGSEITRTDWGWDITHARGERLRIWVAAEYGRLVFPPDPLDGELVKLGSEREFSDLLADRLHLIDDDLTLVAREAPTDAGPADLLAVTRSGDPVVIEVKRRKISQSAYYQARRYAEALCRSERWAGRQVRAILVGPVLQKPARAAIDRDDRVTFVRLSYQDLVDEPPRS